MNEQKNTIKALNRIAWAPYDDIENPTREDWQKSYYALRKLCELQPKNSLWPNTLGYLCYYGRHTGGERRYGEARVWFEKGAALRNIESTYKLADMLAAGLGGEKDLQRAGRYYLLIYRYTKEQFEHGDVECKFADAALRIGRLFHEGTIAEKNDMEALRCLLEAKYAIAWRKPYRHYGDETVEKNILDLIDACEKPGELILKSRFHPLFLQSIHQYLLTPSQRMTIDIETADDGSARLEFRRNRKDGKKPDRIFMSVAPAMKCFMTEFIVLYGRKIRRIWSSHPGEQILADEYQYNQKTENHRFLLEGEEQLSIRGGDYILPMDEFWVTLLRDHPDSASSIPQ